MVDWPAADALLLLSCTLPETQHPNFVSPSGEGRVDCFFVGEGLAYPCCCHVSVVFQMLWSSQLE